MELFLSVVPIYKKIIKNCLILKVPYIFTKSISTDLLFSSSKHFKTNCVSGDFNSKLRFTRQIERPE